MLEYAQNFVEISSTAFCRVFATWKTTMNWQFLVWIQILAQAQVTFIFHVAKTLQNAVTLPVFLSMLSYFNQWSNDTLAKYSRSISS